ncbi:MAG: hypothetical protein KGM83_11300 [Betaproteobacteria bacterium]|nr:hypothetical protein [Betaproteobacteria bacterium]
MSVVHFPVPPLRFWHIRPGKWPDLCTAHFMGLAGDQKHAPVTLRADRHLIQGRMWEGRTHRGLPIIIGVDGLRFHERVAS